MTRERTKRPVYCCRLKQRQENGGSCAWGGEGGGSPDLHQIQQADLGHSSCNILIQNDSQTMESDATSNAAD